MVCHLMAGFAERTGLLDAERPPTRYLWTDAFAVCNFIGIWRRHGDVEALRRARHLVEQVHQVLGKHRADDPRSGWLSGLDAGDGERHPTVGGLRIGKRLPERRPEEPFDERLEWDRDGQYFHYLTKWMHALDRLGQATGDACYGRWAIELAKTAGSRFTHRDTADGPLRMYWKMSIDLDRPLVPAMGQQDALDALVTYRQLQADDADEVQLSLRREIEQATEICEGLRWRADEPLGLGGLLTAACTLVELEDTRETLPPRLLRRLLRASMQGLARFAATHQADEPADQRLAFRELGLCIGLSAVTAMSSIVERDLAIFPDSDELQNQLSMLAAYGPFAEQILEFWLLPRHREVSSWIDHRDINDVMLATSLAPEGYLLLDTAVA
jgi:hypothetical protein